MPIIVKGEKFDPAPDGMHPGVCVDIVDMGIIESTYSGQTKKQHKIRLVWEIAATREDGSQYLVQKRYTASLHEKSALYKDLKSWRGRAFTPEELKGFDVEKLLHVPCTLMLVHEEREGNVYANISAIGRAEKGNELKPSGKYVRVKDRDPSSGVPDTNGAPDHVDADGDDVPF